MTDVRRRVARLAGTVAMVGSAWLATGCGSTDASGPAPTAAPTPPATAQPPAKQPPSRVSCGSDLTRAVHSKSPGFGEIAVGTCRDGWAYLGATDGTGDTEQLWRAEDGAWRWVTSMPSALCPVDLQDAQAPRWVVALFAYRAYDC